MNDGKIAKIDKLISPFQDLEMKSRLHSNMEIAHFAQACVQKPYQGPAQNSANNVESAKPQIRAKLHGFAHCKSQAGNEGSHDINIQLP